MARIVLAVIGIAYMALGLWCAISPVKTSDSIGLTLRPGQGQSEYFTVYGGLQIGLGLVFLLPLLRPEVANFALLTCMVVHGSLVMFRSISFLKYSGFETTTYVFAGIEWAVLITTASAYWLTVLRR